MPVVVRPRLLRRRQVIGLRTAWVVAAVTVTAVVTTVPAPAGAAPKDARALSAKAIPATSAWKSHVIDPTASVIRPTRAYATTPTTKNVAALVSGHGTVTLTSTKKQGASFDVDLGVDTSGYGLVTVGSVTGLPTGKKPTPLPLAAGKGGHGPKAPPAPKPKDLELRINYSEQRAHLSDADSTHFGTLGDDDGDWQDGFVPQANRTWTSSSVRGGERWLRVRLTGEGVVTLKAVGIKTTVTLPGVKGYGGYFLSSDNVLNRAWYASAYTEDLDRIPNAKGSEVLIDGAKHDRLIWSGDLAMEALTAEYTSNTNLAAVKTSLNLLSCQVAAGGYVPAFSPVVSGCPVHRSSRLMAEERLPEYVGWYVYTLDQYYLATGDSAFTRKAMSAARAGIGYLDHRMAGNLIVDQSNELTWHPAAGSTQPAGAYAASNAVTVIGLKAMADLELRLGSPAASVADDAQAAATSSAVVATFWDPSTGTLIGNASDPQHGHTQDAAVWGIIAGILANGSATAPANSASSALAFLATRLATPYGTSTVDKATDVWMPDFISPFVGGWEAIARLQQNDTAGALKLIRQEWGHMAFVDPSTTVWEAMGLNGDPSNPDGILRKSLAHGWSTGPVTALSGYVAGIQATQPGWGGWSIAPQPGDLSWAQAQVPTPHGSVISRWSFGANRSSFTLTAGSTVGSGNVTVPTLGAPRVLAMDGTVIWNGSQAVAGVSVYPAPSGLTVQGIHGIHTFAWTA